MTTTNDKVRSLFLSAMLVMSVFAGVTAFAGSAAAANLNDDQIVFQGETITAQNSDWSGDTVQLYTYEDGSVGTYVDQYTADDNGQISFDSDDREGKYILQGPDQSAADEGMQFQVVEQTFSLEETNVSATTDTETITLTLDNTNRAGSFDVNVTSEANGFENVTTESEGTHDFNRDGDRTIDVDISSLGDEAGTGNYTLTVDVADTTASEEVNLELTEPGNLNAYFPQSVISDERGDVVDIPVEMENTDTANVTIGSSEVNFVADVHIEDGDDDGSNATIQLNTALTPGNEDFITLADSSDSFVTEDIDGTQTTDGVVYRAGSGLDKPLASGNYEVGVSVRDTTSDDWRPVNVATVSISERSTDAAQTWIAPEGDITAGETEAADLTSIVTDRDNVASGDYAVVQVEASGLYGDLSEDTKNKLSGATGENSESGDGLALTITQEDPGPNSDAYTFSGNNEAVSLFTDAENNTFYAAVDTNSDAVDPVSDDDSTGLTTGDWNATFTVTPDFNSLVSENESVSTTFSVEDRTAEINGGDDVVAPVGETNITGTTNLAPGTDFTVQARAGGSFLKSSNVEVGQNGEFSAPFDFSDAQNGTEFTVSLRNTGGSVDYDTVSGTVSSDAPTDVSNTTTTTETTTTTTETTTTTTEETTTTTTTEEMTEDTTTTTTEESSDGGIPGFGIGVALVAFVAAALLALRRSN